MSISPHPLVSWVLAMAVCCGLSGLTVGVTAANVEVIQDQKAYVGMLFELKVNQHNLQMRESYKNRLPDWLEYNDKEGILYGIAPQGSAGMLFSIDVTPALSGDDAVPDTFTVSVEAGPPKKKDDDSIIRCDPKSSVTTASVQLAGDKGYRDLTPLDKVSVLKVIAKQINSDTNPFHLLKPNTKYDTVLVSGPGDFKKDDALLDIVWVVGCGNVAGKQVKLLQSLEKKSFNGELSRALSAYLGNGGVTGWRVTNIKSKSARVKRQLHVKPTPTIAVNTVPTPRERITRSRPHTTPLTTTKSRETTTTSPMRLPSTRLAITVATTTTTTTTTTMPTTTTSTTITTPPREPATTTAESTTTKKMRPKNKNMDKNRKGNTTGGRRVPVCDNKIPTIKMYAGDILDYEIPANTFSDKRNSGPSVSTRQLRLSLRTSDDLEITEGWIQFDEQKQRIIGQMVTPNEAGKRRYLLFATDSDDQRISTDVHIIIMNPDRLVQHNHEFSMRILTSYRDFIAMLPRRIDIANKLAAAFGDSDTSNIRLLEARKGSLVYTWTNTSLSNKKSCPLKELNQLADKITKNNRVHEDFANSMDPYTITTVSLIPMGICDNKMPVLDTKPDIGRDPKQSTDESGAGGLMQYLIPALIVGACVLVATCCVVCVLCCRNSRRRKRGRDSQKLYADNDEDSFIKKSIPVILRGEDDSSTSGAGAKRAPPLISDDGTRVGDFDTDETDGSDGLDSPAPPTYAVSPSLQRQQQQRLLAGGGGAGAQRVTYS